MVVLSSKRRNMAYNRPPQWLIWERSHAQKSWDFGIAHTSSAGVVVFYITGYLSSVDLHIYFIITNNDSNCQSATVNKGNVVFLTEIRLWGGWIWPLIWACVRGLKGWRGSHRDIWMRFWGSHSPSPFPVWDRPGSGQGWVMGPGCRERGCRPHPAGPVLDPGWTNWPWGRYTLARPLCHCPALPLPPALYAPLLPRQAAARVAGRRHKLAVMGSLVNHSLTTHWPLTDPFYVNHPHHSRLEHLMLYLKPWLAW